jgi:integrase/recombinase XerD
MALTIFRRHLKRCPQKDRYFRRCQCPIHVEGTLGTEEVRKGLNLTSWEAAQNLIAEWNRAGKVGGDRVEPVSVTEAVELYLSDVAARVRPSTVRLHRVLLRDSLVPWCELEGIKMMNRLDVKALVRYRASWSYAPLTALKKFERLRSFFRFCHAAKWVDVNPMAALKPPKVDTPPTLPFSDDEVERTIQSARGFKIQGSYGKDNPVRVVAYVYLLRYSGLRISDATGLAKDRVTDDGRLFLHMQHKTRVPVYVPLPPFVVAALRDLHELFPERPYYFWTGSGKLETAVKSWKRTLARVFEIAGVKGGHAHRFRDTFSVSLLLKGVPLETVSQLLGHRSTKVTEQSYAPWIKARQDKLEEAVRSTWEEPKPKLKVIQGGA